MIALTPNHVETLALPSPTQRDLASQSNVPAFAGLLDAIEERVLPDIVRPPDSRLTICKPAPSLPRIQGKASGSPAFLGYRFTGMVSSSLEGTTLRLNGF